MGEKEIERTVKKRVSEKQREKEKKELKRECVCCKFTLCLIAVRYIKKKKNINKTNLNESIGNRYNSETKLGEGFDFRIVSGHFAN